ncbi:LysM peptidoglycan-binding domain-containing M23 family metallopeptidase [Massilia sp. W12]|uniref:LysM peptidoglycan-binding domain-containing M23 family metallopeptidase n=1 Tax=Massilia sp. W12 TaxID=3126507 RepID=UPI0030CEB5D3
MAEYVVKPRDTLWKIAKAHGTTVDALAHLNGMKGSQVHHLAVGQKIKLPGAAGVPDCLLQLQFRGLDFNSFTPKNIKLEYDGKTVVQSFEQGLKTLQVAVNDHAQGLKVWIEDMEKKLVQVVDQQVLAPGKWMVGIDSRQVSLKGNLLPQKGKQEAAVATVQKNSAQAAQKASGATVQEQTRTEAGTPMHAMASIYTEKNLRLPPANEEYRKYLIDSASRHGQTPQALAALVDAEAAKAGKKSKNPGHWLENSNESFPKRAQGLAQFFPAAWAEVFKDPQSLLHQECGSLKESDRLKKRLVAKYAIDAAASYAKLNLKQFERLSKLSVSGLPPEERAKIAYFLHHEGVGGALQVMGMGKYKDSFDNSVALARLKSQIDPEGKNPDRLRKILEQYKGSPVMAYRGWLYSYIDFKINVNHFMVNDPKLQLPVRKFSDILAGLGGEFVAKPMPKPAAAPTSMHTAAPPTSTGGGYWVDPLTNCTLRTALLSVRVVNGKELHGAKFGMVRKGGSKSHQGVDLVALPGTSIYAVANGRVYTNEISKKSDYGNTIILEVGINDLPEDMAVLCEKINPGQKTIGFFYAHLSNFGVPHGTYVHAGDIIGKSGCSGNASNMTTIENGAHLHFEVRKIAQMTCSGLANRLDPLLFIKNIRK